MKRHIVFILVCCLILTLTACKRDTNFDIATTTQPVYEITARLCEGTDLNITKIISEEVSCLHDYTLQPDQMKLLETAKLTVISGAGLEDFMSDYLPADSIDVSIGIPLLHAEHNHEKDHAHKDDPHVWLSPVNGKIMAENICDALCATFPEQQDIFQNNLQDVFSEFDTIIVYGDKTLSHLSCRNIVTFHDGFSYMAEAYNLNILHAVEEESGSEASAKELIEICNNIERYSIPAIFTEQNGSDRAASIISAEKRIPVYTLDMGMSGSYFAALYHNIDTLKEALG